MTVHFPLPRRVVLGLTTVLAALTASVAPAEDIQPTLNLYGSTGTIDLPSGESQPDGMLTASSARFGPVSRNTLTFQLTPRLSASFRYQGVRDWNAVVGSAFDTYFDRNFDLRYQVTREGRVMPAVSVGLQDFIGTGLFSAEYVAATKTLGPHLKVTAGLGWGRLGTYGGIGSPFGDRPPVDVGEGGQVNTNQFFRGPAAPFASLEYRIDDRWTVKAEYSSDDYTIESGRRRTFDRASPFNVGLEYAVHETMRVGAYYMYGSELGLAAQFFINPGQRPTGGIRGGAPDPVEVRPAREADPEAWSPDWVTQEGIAPILIGNINRRLEKDGIVVEAIGYTGTTAQVRIRNDRNDSEAQAVGRVARVMTAIMPASVEVFEIVPVVRGMPVAKVTLRRSDLERLEFAPGAAEAIRDRAAIGDAGAPAANLAFDPARYPRFQWNLAPFLRTRLFDPENPIRADLGLRLGASYDLAPGLVVAGSVSKRLTGNLRNSRQGESALPRVRTDGVRYDREGDPALDTLTLAYYRRLAPEVYGRVTAGYLERMFGGVSTEVLWAPSSGPLALGVEVNYARKRDFDLGLGFQDYDVVTGSASAYYSFGGERSFLAQVDVGRYLAGDYGATISLDRQFENGWSVGAFATFTDVSFEDFGEGSFDKGIKLQIPVNWFLGTPTRQVSSAVIRPLTRDGGARLNVDGRLYGTVRDYGQQGFDEQWGRFWR